MSDEFVSTPLQPEELFRKLTKEAEVSGYHLNPDLEFTNALIDGLLTNEKRYGYPACPCRLSTGDKDRDRDIICPCDYRDPDLSEHGACYCALYVSQEVIEKASKLKPVPERRLPVDLRFPKSGSVREPKITSLPLPVWRCKVCGYLCGRENPPEVCPICKAQKDRFEQFI